MDRDRRVECQVRRTVLTAVVVGAALVNHSGPAAMAEPGTAALLELQRSSRAGAFVGVVGRRSMLAGYEHGPMEAWVYPLKLLDDLQVGFRVEGYPLEFAGRDVLARVSATPEATTFATAPSGRCSPAGRRLARTRTAGRTSATRRPWPTPCSRTPTRSAT